MDFHPLLSLTGIVILIHFLVCSAGQLAEFAERVRGNAETRRKGELGSAYLGSSLGT